MSVAIEAFDEVHVVSDLHLGGAPGFQVFDQGQKFLRLAKYLAGRPANRRVALIINGDMVDFLAESPMVYFDPDGAAQKLERIAGDPSFLPVFDGLRTFVRHRGRRLIITLGNHDLELQLPWVRERLLDLLTHRPGKTVDAREARVRRAARGRIHLAFDGGGYRCTVAGRDILCVHGNDTDGWNPTDHERLRRIGRDRTQGVDVDPWIPNAGTQLVIDVMNGIKRNYPFIDLLKPETEAALPIVLALDPKQAKKIKRLLPVVGRLKVDAVRRRVGLLSSEESSADRVVANDADRDAALAEIVGRRMRPHTQPDRRSTTAGDALLDRIERQMALGEEPSGLLSDDQRASSLGLFGATWKALFARPREEVLLEALEGLRRDQRFEIDHEDAMFTSLDAEIGPEVDVLIAGHTHLRRSIDRRRAAGMYFNSGTWIPLIRLTAEMLRDAKHFAPVLKTLEKGTREALNDHPGLVIRQATVVSMTASSGRFEAQLHEVTTTGNVLRPISLGSAG